MAGGEETRVIDHVRLTVAVLLAMLLLLLWWRGYGPYSAAPCCAGEAGAGVSTPVRTPAGQPLPPAVTIQPGATEAPRAAVEAEGPGAEPPPAAIETQASGAEPPPAAAEAQAPAAEAPQTAVESPAEPPYALTDPNAQVRTDTASLPRWEGPRPPAFEHEVYVPPPAVAAPVAEEPEAVVTADAPAPGASTQTPEPAQAGESAAPAIAPAAAEGPVESSAAPPSYVIADPNAQVRAAASTLPAWTGPRYAELHHDVFYPPAAEPAAEAAPQVAAGAPPAAKLYFDTARWDLPADADERLAPIVRYLQAHPEARAVIQGFHDPRGPQELNAALAQNRAGAAWAALVAAGVARERIIVRQPVDATGSGSLAEARRAEVSVVGR